MDGCVHPTWLPLLSDPVRLTVLGALCERPQSTAADLSRLTHVSDRAVRRHLELLVSIGIVHEHRGERDGLTQGRPATRFAVDSNAVERVRLLLILLRTPLPAAPR